MSKSKIKLLCFVVCLCLYSCDYFPYYPGLRFELMKDTPVWELAMAVKNEDVDRINELIQEKHLDVNYQEHKSKIATTLLHLAVGNDKLLSVEALLKNGARQNIRDSGGEYPIHYIVCMIIPHKHRLEILKLLLEYGADPNAEAIEYRDGAVIQRNKPLYYAVYDLDCTKMLLKYGADINEKWSGDSTYGYGAWFSVFSSWTDYELDNNVFVAKYLIVDKHMPFPDTLFIKKEDETGKFYSITSMEIINKSKFTRPDKQKAKEEILAYLKQEGFPKHGALRCH